MSSDTAPLRKMTLNPHRNGVRFAVRDGGSWIDDDDFTYDAMIQFSGDFGEGERESYAAELCELLNLGMDTKRAAAANLEARADSAVPSSHVSETDDLAAKLRDSSGSYINGLYDREAADEIERLRVRESVLREALARLVPCLEDWVNDFAHHLEGGESTELVTFSREAIAAARSVLARMPK